MSAQFLLDTDTLSLLQRNHPTVRANVSQHPATAITISSLSIQEQVEGWLRAINNARGPQQLARAHELLTGLLMSTWARFSILFYSQPAILRHDQLRALRLNVGAMDLKIAAVALEGGLTVVTRNRRDFGRVPGLALVDWSV